ncbi:MAG TPA: Crp/Fnr family transcriptional regulator [Nitrospirae bacterium]|nr:Crp/Fnr family transcriptional regulator [Nitrospirota bacterium]
MIEDLSEITIFKGLAEEELKELDGYLKRERYNKRDIIFGEGDPSDFLYIVKKGKVKITKMSQEGKEIILEIISPGDMFGAVAVLQGFPYPANAVAMEKTEVIKLHRNALMRILDRFPSVMYCLAMNIGERMRGSHEMLKNIALERVEARIAALLLKLADKMGEDTEEGRAINMKLTKQDVADMVGTTVETSIRTMSKFKKRGLIKEKGGRVIITDLPALREISS